MLGTSGQSVDKFGIITDYLVKNKVISEILGNQFRKIRQLTNQGVESGVVLKAVNDLKLQNYNDSDQKYINAFVSVYNSSNSFWYENENSSAIKTQSLKTNVAASPCGDAVILADAAGAAYGLLGGPAWSIIEGAIFSLLTNNSDVCNFGKSS